MDATTREFLRLFGGSGRILGSPWEPLSVETVRSLVLEVWRDEMEGWWEISTIDKKILDLAKGGVLSLHEHDFPQSVAQKSTLLQAGGRFFCLASVRHEVVECIK